MKYAYATLAVIVAVAQAQQISDIPSCAITCFTTALSNNPCETLTDFACQCRQTQLIPTLIPCVESSCTPAEVEGVRNAAQALCASVGVPVQIPTEGGAEEEAEPATETTVTEAVSTATETATVEEAEDTPTPTPSPAEEAEEEQTTTISTQTTVQTTVETTETATAGEETDDDDVETYIYGSAPPATTSQTTLTTTSRPAGVAQPTAGVPRTNATTPSVVVPPFTGAANQVVVGTGPVGGLLVFVLAAVYAL